MYLITESVTPDDDGVFPAWDGLRNAAEDDGFTEDGAPKNVSDLVVWSVEPRL